MIKPKIQLPTMTPSTSSPSQLVPPPSTLPTKRKKKKSDSDEEEKKIANISNENLEVPSDSEFDGW